MTTPKYVYHYTTKDGKNGIEKEMKIRKSTKKDNDDDAAFGEGVYFTQLGPETKTADLVQNNFNQDGPNAPHKLTEWLKEKVHFCFKIATSTLKGLKKMPVKRDVWKIRGDLTLHPGQYEVIERVID